MVSFIHDYNRQYLITMEENIMNEEDLRIIKGGAAILESMSGSKNDVNYTEEALSVLAEQLYEVIERNEKER